MYSSHPEKNQERKRKRFVAVGNLAAVFPSQAIETFQAGQIKYVGVLEPLTYDTNPAQKIML